MRDDFDMNDIILNNENPKNTNIKKILTAVAILVVLFLIVLIIMKFINHGNVNTSNDLVMPSEDQVLKPKETQTTAQPQPDSSAKTTNPIIVKEIAPPQEVKQVVVQPAPQEPKEEKQATATQETVKPVEIIKPNESEKPVQITKPNEPVKHDHVTKTKEPVKTQETTKPTAKATSTKKTKESAKQEQKSTTKAGAVHKPVATIKAGNYIQIFAVSTFNQNHDFVKRLVQKGYDVVPYQTKVNNNDVIKVLVGPYSGTELQNSLKDIKANINKQAFIFKAQ